MAGPYTLVLDVPQKITLGTTPNVSEFDFPVGARTYEVLFVGHAGAWYPTGTEGAAQNAAGFPIAASNWVVQPVPGTQGKAPNMNAAGRKVFLSSDTTSCVVHIVARGD